MYLQSESIIMNASLTGFWGNIKWFCLLHHWISQLWNNCCCFFKCKVTYGWQLWGYESCAFKLGPLFCCKFPQKSQNTHFGSHLQIHFKSFSIYSKIILFPLHYNSCFWPPTPWHGRALFLHPLKKKHKPCRTSQRTWPDTVNQSDTSKCQHSLHLSFARLENSVGDLKKVASTSRSWNKRGKKNL